MSDHADQLADHFRRRDPIAEWYEDHFPFPNGTLFAEAVLASPWLADLLAGRAESLLDAARELRAQAVKRFAAHGPHDARGAALWDAGCHIDPYGSTELNATNP